MINVSTQLKKESITNRNYYVTANVTLSDGTTLKLGKKDFYLSGNSLVDSSDSGDFPVGMAIEKTASLSLVNDDGRFDDYNFNGARFVIFLNLQLSDKLETIKRGTYIVSKKPATASEISLSLLDKMHNTDKTYDSNLSFPCTVKELLSECCQQCGITLGDAMFPNADFQIQQVPSNTTYRAAIGMCAGIAGGNARIDENDLLRVITFNKTFTNTTIYDGGAVKNWTNGDDLDGGTLNPWTTGTVVDGGTLSNNDYHALFSIQNLQYDVDDVIVTGIKYIEDETEYMSGQDGYVITVDNQLLSGNARAGVEAIGNQLIGLRMRPFSCDGIANGYATFGDPVEFIDTKNRVFRSFATDIEFVFGGSTSWSCSAKSAEEDASEFIGEQQAAVEQAKKDAEKKLSAYDIKLKQMNELAANTLGFYYTEEVQADGSTISYRHDKPTLADSKVIYKTSADGFFLSVDGGQTWKAGFDSNGDAVLNILYAIGIQSEWINTRGFTAKDNNGNTTLGIDADTGAVDIVANSFSLKGKTIEDVAGAAAKSYVDSAIQDKTGNWYGNYTPTLSNQPASSWKAADYEKHNGDTFINPLTGDIYVFSAGTQTSTTAQWVSVTKVDAAEIIKQLDQETIFNLLTNNGEAKGIWLKNNQLYVSFTYAQGGTLKLGGANNDNGAMQILDSSDNVIGSWDKDGIIATEGKIADFNIENGGLYKEKNGIQQSFGTDNAILSMYNTSSQKWIMYLRTDGGAVFNRDSNYSSDDFTFGGSAWFTGAGTFGGKVIISGDLTVYGDKNREVDTENYGRQLAYCYETATPYFGDLGHGMTDENGVCLIEIDDIFREIVGEQEYLVFLQPEGEGDLYVNKAEKYCNYFIVRGTANLSFAWEIKNIQKEKQFTRFGTDSERGMLDIDYTDLEETLISDINNPLIETEEMLWEN